MRGSFLQIFNLKILKYIIVFVFHTANNLVLGPSIIQANSRDGLLLLWYPAISATVVDHCPIREMVLIVEELVNPGSWI